MIYEVWTDASHRENVGEDGLDIGVWSFIIVKDNEEYYNNAGIVLETTSSAMELYSVHQSMFHVNHFLPDGLHFELYSDAKYIVDGLNKDMYDWAKRGWKRRAGRLANKEIWKQIYYLSKKKDISYNWAPGHCKICWNEEAHKLAKSTLNSYINNMK